MANTWAMLDGCGICPACRRVVPGERPCDLDGSVVRPISSLEDKQALIEAVWGSSAKRTELVRQAATGTATAGTRMVAALALGAACVGVASGLGVVSEAATIAAGVLGAALGGAMKKSRRILVPSGGSAIAPQPRFASGEILPCDVVVAPGSGLECVAWALELRYDGQWGARITLRVGASVGFHVALDGGERALIPAGPLWIPDALPQLAELESPLLEELLRVLDPTRSGDTEPWPVFSFNVVSEQILQIGDRVEILGAMDRELVSGRGDAMYRDAPASVLVPRVLPALRLLSSQ